MSTVHEATTASPRIALPVPDARPLTAPPATVRPGARGLVDGLLGAPWTLPALDALALSLAVAGTLAWTPGDAGLLRVAALPALGVAVLALRGAYAPRLRATKLDSVALAAGAVSVAAMIDLALGAGGPSGTTASPLLLRAWLLAVAFVGAERVVVTLARERLRRAGLGLRRTLIVGAGDVGARVARRLAETPAVGLRPIGFLEADPPPPEEVGGRPAPILGTPADLLDIVAARDVEHVVLAFTAVPDHAILPALRRCAAAGVGVSLVPRLFDFTNERVAYEAVGGLPLMTLRATDPRGASFAVKHAFDRAAAVALIFVVAPLMAAIAMAVKATSPGPVLFRQRRVGCDGRVFDMLKFRTMVGGGDEPPFVPAVGRAPGGVEGADRRTWLGCRLRRLSLDELPQLFNVVRGEMSLVGPRPERPEYVRWFAAGVDRYDDRHRVRAGITGMAQVHGLRGQSSIAERVELDNYYIEHWSLGMDLRLLLMTALVLLRPAAQ